MHHSFIDKYSDLATPVHQVDARLKIAACIVALICILSIPVGFALGLVLYALILMSFWFFSKLPLIHLLKRLAITTPFIALMALGTIFADGQASVLHKYIFIVAKAALAIVTLTLLTSTTRFPNLLKGFDWFGMPNIMTALLAFIYRYIFILIDEAERLSIGRKSRQFTDSRAVSWKSLAWMIGTLFLRSFERSERIYRAMLARGFAGKIYSLDRPKKPNFGQFVAITLASLSFIAVRLAPMFIKISSNIL